MDYEIAGKIGPTMSGYIVLIFLPAGLGGGNNPRQIWAVPSGVGVYSGTELDQAARGEGHTGQE